MRFVSHSCTLYPKSQAHAHMTLPIASQLVQTAADRLAQEEQERAERKRRDLAEQRSDANPPDVRIRAWEKLHGLRLPADPAHPILDVVAVGTRLTLAQVREEQGARAARSAVKIPPKAI
ncbi:MAG TPA: hypothetical protein VKQ31_12830 [Steroidobacteraceae bacterium]|nr:hypothetical protein [Steroidobacteraceae bacterium]